MKFLQLLIFMIIFLLINGPLHHILDRFLYSFLDINHFRESLYDSLGYFISLLSQSLLVKLDSLFSEGIHDCLLIDLADNAGC